MEKFGFRTGVQKNNGGALDERITNVFLQKREEHRETEWREEHTSGLHLINILI